MTPRTLGVTVAVAAGILVACLVSSLVWLYASQPRSGPFDASFSLVDDRGQGVDKSAFLGRPSLVFFGYTKCPEVCPTTLLEVADWLQTLGPEGKDLAAYFFTVDPERDTPDVMRDYVAAFGDRIVGVTGRPEEMRKVMDGWMIRAAKVPSADGGYSMSHTITLLMIGADGRLKGLIPYGTEREAAMAKIRAVLLGKVRPAV